MNRKYAISVMSEDRPGIVASVSRIVYELDGNICALSQTVMNGYFTIIIVAEFPSTVTGDILEEKLLHAGSVGEYSVMTREYKEPVLPDNLKQDANEYMLTATGPDTRGIIFQISENLAKRGINILDISGSLKKDQIVLIAQLLVPQDVDISCLQDELAALGMSKKLSVQLQHVNIFRETNRI